jgi:hypothetical protein
MVLPFAEVTIDGTPAGETPIRRSLKPGKHVVELRNDGLNKRESFTVTILPGKVVRTSRRWTE